MELKLAYLGLTIVTILFLTIIGFKAINESSSYAQKNKMKLLLGLILWQLLILLVDSTGILKPYEFPPRFAIAFIIPFFLLDYFYIKEAQTVDLKHPRTLDYIFSVF